MAKFDLNDLHSDAGHLMYLVQVIYDVYSGECVHAVPEGAKPGDRLEAMDKLGALLWIARDLADGIEKNISDNFGAIGSTCKNWKPDAEVSE